MSVRLSVHIATDLARFYENSSMNPRIDNSILVK